jgi:hypothetical protein
MDLLDERLPGRAPSDPHAAGNSSLHDLPRVHQVGNLSTTINRSNGAAQSYRANVFLARVWPSLGPCPTMGLPSPICLRRPHALETRRRVLDATSCLSSPLWPCGR